MGGGAAAVEVEHEIERWCCPRVLLLVPMRSSYPARPSTLAMPPRVPVSLTPPASMMTIIIACMMIRKDKRHIVCHIFSLSTVDIWVTSHYKKLAKGLCVATYYIL